jgi:hypothetical protein
MTRRAVARAAEDGILRTSALEVFTNAVHFADAAAGHPDLLAAQMPAGSGAEGRVAKHHPDRGPKRRTDTPR